MTLRGTDGEGKAKRNGKHICANHGGQLDSPPGPPPNIYWGLYPLFFFLRHGVENPIVSVSMAISPSPPQCSLLCCFACFFVCFLNRTSTRKSHKEWFKYSLISHLMHLLEPTHNSERPARSVRMGRERCVQAHQV